MDVSTVFAILTAVAFAAFIVSQIREARKRRREIAENQDGKKLPPDSRPRPGDVHEN